MRYLIATLTVVLLCLTVMSLAADEAAPAQASSGPEGLMMASAGSMLITMGDVVETVAVQVPAAAGTPSFSKVRREYIRLSRVWFQGRESDLEGRAFIRGGRMYITATDFGRHVGGVLTWGPTSSWIQLQRSDLTIRIIPGSATVYVNGQPQSMGAPALRVQGRTYIPIRPYAELLGLRVHFQRGYYERMTPHGPLIDVNAPRGRVYVDF